jgi:hypothetical protein
MKFNFKQFWDSDCEDEQQEIAEKMVAGLVANGVSEANAIAMVEKFQKNAFYDGHADGVYDSCGEDA